MPANSTLEGGEPPTPLVVRGVVLGPVAIALASATTAGASSWIEPADTGALAALEVLADAIDELRVSPEPDYEKLRKLCGTFLNGLGVMGLTPAGRGRLELEGEVPDDGAALVALVGGRATA